MEIRSINHPARVVTNTAHDKPDSNVSLPATAHEPAASTTTASAVRAPSRSAELEQTKQAVQDIERMMKLFSQNVEFSYDSDAHRTIMRVVDQQTKEVIRQVPTQEALEIAKALEKIQDMLLMQGSRGTRGR